MIAPTGSGKTTRFVIPNILNCSGSIVVTDPSGEIFEKTSGYLQSRRYHIRVLQPAKPEQSRKFNPLRRCQSQTELKRIATTLGQNNTGKDPFWTTGAINIIYICLCALVNTQDETRIHLGGVRRLLNDFGVNGEGVNDFMIKYLNEAEFAEYKAFLSQDGKVIASVLSSARAALDLWSDPEIVRLTASDNIDLENLRHEKTVIYIIIPEHQIGYYSLLINLFYSACFEYILQDRRGMDGWPIFFFLDEFGNLGRVANFAAIATTLRKRRCSVNIILQELSQLEAVYSKSEAKAIFSGGMGNKLFFSGLDLDTCTYLERVLGKNTERESADGEIKSARAVAKSLLSVDEIRMLKETEGILISGAKKPIKIKMPTYFNFKPWHRMTKKCKSTLDLNKLKD